MWPVCWRREKDLELAELSWGFIKIFTEVVRLLRRPCRLASNSLRDHLAFGAVRCCWPSSMIINERSCTKSFKQTIAWWGLEKRFLQWPSLVDTCWASVSFLLGYRKWCASNWLCFAPDRLPAFLDAWALPQRGQVIGEGQRRSGYQNFLCTKRGSWAFDRRLVPAALE